MQDKAISTGEKLLTEELAVEGEIVTCYLTGLNYLQKGEPKKALPLFDRLLKISSLRISLLKTTRRRKLILIRRSLSDWTARSSTTTRQLPHWLSKTTRQLKRSWRSQREERTMRSLQSPQRKCLRPSSRHSKKSGSGIRGRERETAFGILKRGRRFKKSLFYVHR